MVLKERDHMPFDLTLAADCLVPMYLSLSVSVLVCRGLIGKVYSWLSKPFRAAEEVKEENEGEEAGDGEVRSKEREMGKGERTKNKTLS